MSEWQLSYKAAPIKSRAKLVQALGLQAESLEQALEDPDSHYRFNQIAKSSGEARQLTVPDDFLKALQRRIVTRLFSNVAFPRYLYGGVRDHQLPRDYIGCAQRHCGAGSLATEDISAFFDNVTPDHAFQIFNELFNFSDDVSHILARLTTFDEMLPQGAPTSSGIANMVFFQREPRTAQQCADAGVTYTRFVDDIALSHPDPGFNLEPYRQSVLRTLRKGGFSVNQDKSTKKITNTKTLLLMNIEINFKTPRIPKRERDRIRANVHDVERKAKIPNVRKTPEYHHFWHKASGRLNKLKRLGYPQYYRLRRRLRQVMPLVGDHEPKRLKNAVSHLENQVSHIANRHAFITSLNRIRNRVGILGRSHPELAAHLNRRITGIRNELEAS